MNNLKLKGFTIMETLIGMMLSCLLIGFTFFAYLMIHQASEDFIRKNEAATAFLVMDNLLKKDFLNADTIKDSPNGFTIRVKNDSVVYLITPTATIRTGNRTDTLKVPTIRMSKKFENTELTGVPPYSRIDDLSLQVIIRGDSVNWHFHKYYSSENLINQ